MGCTDHCIVRSSFSCGSASVLERLVFGACMDGTRCLARVAASSFLFGHNWNFVKMDLILCLTVDQGPCFFIFLFCSWCRLRLCLRSLTNASDSCDWRKGKGKGVMDGLLFACLFCSKWCLVAVCRRFIMYYDSRTEEAATNYACVWSVSAKLFSVSFLVLFFVPSSFPLFFVS